MEMVFLYGAKMKTANLELSELFNKYSLVETYDILHARAMSDAYRFTENENLKGIASGNVAGTFILGAVAQIVQMRKFKEQSEKISKQRTQDAFFLDLLRKDTLDAYIAEKIVESMTDAQVAETISFVEAKTGMTFDEYAQGILGADMPDRMPLESDPEYQRRVLEAVMEEVMHDGQIKPEYVDDPIAQIVIDSDFYQSVLPTINRLNATEAPGAAPSAEAINTVHELATGSYQTGFHLSENVQNEELVGESQNVRDDDRDNHVEGLAEAELGLFGAATGIEFVSGPGLENAPDVTAVFQQAATNTIAEASPISPAPDLTATL